MWRVVYSYATTTIKPVHLLPYNCVRLCFALGFVDAVARGPLCRLLLLLLLLLLPGRKVACKTRCLSTVCSRPRNVHLKTLPHTLLCLLDLL